MSDWFLAIDTSTEACSCALGNGQESYSRYTDLPRKHAEQVLPMISELLAEAGIKKTALSAIAFGRGPGAFTGLRIAASVVQGLAYALDIPVLAISSLQVLAQRAWREQGAQQVIAAIDARMNEAYWAAFRFDAASSTMQPVTREQLSAPQVLGKQLVAEFEPSAWAGAGTGWQYADILPEGGKQLGQIYPLLLTHASDLLFLAQHDPGLAKPLPPEQALPVYLRNQVVQS